MERITLTPEKWLEALKSHRYKRLRGSLSNEYGASCCLGVLMHEAGLGDLIRLEDGTTADGDLQSTVLPPGMQPEWMSDEDLSSLVEYNDYLEPGKFPIETPPYWEDTGVLEYIQRIIIDKGNPEDFDPDDL